MLIDFEKNPFIKLFGEIENACFSDTILPKVKCQFSSIVIQSIFTKLGFEKSDPGNEVLY